MWGYCQPVSLRCTFSQSLWKLFVRKIFPREYFLKGEYEKEFVCDYSKGKTMLPCPICGRELVRGLIRTPHIFPIPVKVIFCLGVILFSLRENSRLRFPRTSSSHLRAVVGRAVCDDAEHFLSKAVTPQRKQRCSLSRCAGGIAEDGIVRAPPGYWRY